MSLQLTQWACCDLFVRSPDELTMQWWELQTHWTLIARSQCELIWWVHCELTECHQNEPTMRLFRWALCEYGVSSLLHWASNNSRLFWFSTDKTFVNCMLPGRIVVVFRRFVSWISWKLVIPSRLISWKTNFLISAGSGFYLVWLGREPLS